MFKLKFFNSFGVGSSVTEPLSLNGVLRGCTATWVWTVHAVKPNF